MALETQGFRKQTQYFGLFPRLMSTEFRPLVQRTLSIPTIEKEFGAISSKYYVGILNKVLEIKLHTLTGNS